jgi:hypothetical protein
MSADDAMAAPPAAEPVIPRTTILGNEMDVPHTFFRGEHTTFLPDAVMMEAPDALARHVLSGWMPPEPIIGPDTTIVAFGSCFAGSIARYLQNIGYDVATRKEERAYVSAMGDGIVNTFAIRQQFEWAWLARTPSVKLWHGYKAEEFGYDEDIRLSTKELFDRAEVFIITLGLSEVWYDEPTGEVFWRAVPYDKYDAARHRFRVATAAENFENLKAIYDLIRTHRPEAAIVFTMSPVPLTATFRNVSAITANAASKAHLRSGLDQLIDLHGAGDARLFYFPSYEVITFPFRVPFAGDLRHPHLHLVLLNMKAFERYFCQTGLTDADLSAAYLNALLQDRALSTEGSVEATTRLMHEAQAWLDANPAVLVRQAAEMERTNAAASEGRRLREERQAEIALRLRERDERLQAREEARAQREAEQAARQAARLTARQSARQSARAGQRG